MPDLFQDFSCDFYLLMKNLPTLLSITVYLSIKGESYLWLKKSKKKHLQLRITLFFMRQIPQKKWWILVLLPTHPRTLEIVNIAVSEDSRGRGIGQELLHFAIDFAKKEKYDYLEIGTGSTGFQQLYLYQKVGFRMTHIEPDFFIHHYDEPIIENGLPLKDMVRLRLHLS